MRATANASAVLPIVALLCLLLSFVLCMPSIASADLSYVPTLDARFGDSELVVVGSVYDIIDTTEHSQPVGPILLVNIEDTYKGQLLEVVAVLPVYPARSDEFGLNEQVPLYLSSPIAGSPAADLLAKLDHPNGFILQHEPRIARDIPRHKAILEVLAFGMPKELLLIDDPAARQSGVHWIKAFDEVAMKEVLVIARGLQETTDEILQIIETSMAAFPNADDRVEFLRDLRWQTQSPTALRALYAQIQQSKMGDEIIFDDLFSSRAINRAAALTQVDKINHPELPNRLEALAAYERSQIVLPELARTLRVNHVDGMDILCEGVGPFYTYVRVLARFAFADEPTADRVHYIAEGWLVDDWRDQVSAFEAMAIVASGNSDFALDAQEWLLKKELNANRFVRAAQVRVLAELAGVLNPVARLALLGEAAISGQSDTATALDAALGVLMTCSESAENLAEQISTSSAHGVVKLTVGEVLSKWNSQGGRVCK